MMGETKKAPFDLAGLGEQTRRAVAGGSQLLQVHRFGKSDAEHVSRLMRWAQFQTHGRIIDMGCGVGAMASMMRRLGMMMDITLLNISQEQLDMCPAGFEKVCAPFEDTGLPAEWFDGAMFCFSIGHGDPAQAMRETFRILRPGGVLMVYDMARLWGDNTLMHQLSYEVHGADWMENIAVLAGFEPDICIFPRRYTTPAYVIEQGIMGCFDGTVPVVWRFVKPKP